MRNQNDKEASVLLLTSKVSFRMAYISCQFVLT
uniref:Uncharacterized protein n=1 Tax=Arundo donax TaxID=35708 RepID=A0A0A9CXD6_ARUDO